MDSGAADTIRDILIKNDGTILGIGSSGDDTALINFNIDGSLSSDLDGTNTLDGTPVFVEGGAAVVLDSDVNVRDADLDAGNAGATYVWSTGETTQTILVDTTGVGIGTLDVWVEVTNANLCANTDEITIQFDDCTGISEIVSVIS